MSVLTMHTIDKRYRETVALAGVSMTVQPGEIVALLGPNGAGKTTVFELLLGLARPSAGTVTVFGAPPGSNRPRIGAMVQSAGLPEQLTVRELVWLMGCAYPHPLGVGRALDRVGLAQRSRRPVTALSGGERQRLLLAMAIVGSPELLLLDEPTAAMDVAARRRFWRQARVSVADGATILFATHDLHEAEAVADRVIVLAGGHVVADSTPEKLTTLADGPDLEEVFLALTDEYSTEDEGVLS